MMINNIKQMFIILFKKSISYIQIDVNFMTKESYKVLRSKFVSGKKIYNAMCEFFFFFPLSKILVNVWGEQKVGLTRKNQFI